MSLLDELGETYPGLMGETPAPQRGLIEAEAAMPAPIVRPKRESALNTFVSDLMFSLAESFAAGPQRGAGLAAALGAPMKRRALIQDTQEKSLLTALAVQKQEEEIAKLRRDRIKDAQTIDYNERVVNGRKVKEAVVKHTGEVLWSSDLGPAPTENIDPLSPEGIAATVTKEQQLAGVKPEKPQYNESWWIDSAIRMAEAKEGKPLSDFQKTTIAGKARAEWAEMAREKNPQLDAMNLQIKQLQLDAAEARLAAAQSGGLSPAQFNQAQRLADDFMRDSKNFIIRREAYDNIRSAAENPSAAGDLALIFAYMRMLDPGSTVREGEFANAQNAAGVPDRIRNMYNKAISGERLNPTQRQDFLNQAERQYLNALDSHKVVEETYRNRAKAQKLPEESVVYDLGSRKYKAPATGGDSKLKGVSTDDLLKRLSK